MMVTGSDPGITLPIQLIQEHTMSTALSHGGPLTIPDPIHEMPRLGPDNGVNIHYSVAPGAISAICQPSG